MRKHRTDVLIVGAGPTGLALAVALQKAGVSYRLIEARCEHQTTSRAAVVHAHTLDILDRLGVGDELRSKGSSISEFAVRQREQRLLGIGFDQLPSPNTLLMVPQSVTESVLEGRLIALGGKVERGAEAVELTALGNGALARIRGADAEERVEARFVIGGDGLHSLVREAAGIPFDGAANPESFVLADVSMEWPPGAQEVSLFLSPQGLLVVAPLPDGSYRVIADVEEAPAEPTVTDVQNLLATRGPASGVRVDTVLWGSRFRIQHRLARTFRHGPFILMGDAAHVHSPAGGQGMNTGIVDAAVLGEALARIIRGGEGEDLLDAYCAIRRRAAEQVINLAGGLTRMAIVRSPLVRFLRNVVLRLVNRLPPVRTRIALNLSGLARERLSELPARRA